MDPQVSAKHELRDAITLIARYVFKQEPITHKALDKAFAKIEEFENQFSEALNCLDQIREKIGDFDRDLDDLD